MGCDRHFTSLRCHSEKAGGDDYRQRGGPSLCTAALRMDESHVNPRFGTSDDVNVTRRRPNSESVRSNYIVIRSMRLDTAVIT